MARPPQVRPENLKPDTPGRIQLVTWPDYQKGLSNEDSRQYVFVTIFRPTDTILYASVEARLLWWELIRLSGSGRKKGWVVLGKDYPITPRQVADIVHLNLETVVMPGLIENVKEGRIVIISAEPQSNSKKPPINSNDETQVLTTPELHTCISEVKISEVKERGEKAPSFSDFTQKEREEAASVFIAAWQELHGRRWETPDDYLPSGFEKRDLRNLVTPGNLYTYIAYAYHYHHDNGVGIKPGEKAATIDSFLNRAVPGYCSTLREGTTEWEQATGFAREFLAERAARNP